MEEIVKALLERIESLEMATLKAFEQTDEVFKQTHDLLGQLNDRMASFEANPPYPKCGREHYGWPCQLLNGHTGACDTRSKEQAAALEAFRLKQEAEAKDHA